MPGRLDISDIGFGTAGLMGSAITDSGRLSNLSHVYDLGVTHFDTAPLYGLGDAERVLGKFIKNKRNSVTVATKYGLTPPILPWYYQVLVPIARTFRYGKKKFDKNIMDFSKDKNSYGFKYKKIFLAENIVGAKEDIKKQYTYTDMESSLGESLRKLNTDYVDIFLLHDCYSGDISPEVLDSLNRLVKEGKTRIYGFATSMGNIVRIMKRYDDFSGCLQFENHMLTNIPDEIATKESTLKITHSALRNLANPLILHLSDKKIRDRWSKIIDEDLSCASTVYRYLLGYVRVYSPSDTLLISSSNKRHMTESVTFLRNNAIPLYKMRCFRELVITELGTE